MGHTRCCALVKGNSVQTTDIVCTNPKNKELIVMPSPSILLCNGTHTTHTAFGTCLYHLYQWKSISLHLRKICFKPQKYTRTCRHQPRRLFRTFLRRGGATCAMRSGVLFPLIKCQGDWASDAFERYLATTLQD